MRWTSAGLLAVFAVCALNAQVIGTSVSEARYARLARGVNINSWFQYTPIQVTQADVDLLKAAGFTSIRLPVAPQYILPHWASQGTIAANLTRLDGAIDMFLNTGIAVTLDFHADGPYLDYFLSTPGARAELVATWSMLAQRYGNRDPELLFFEIMNEPDNRFTEAAWDSIALEVLAAIRQQAPGHTVLVQPVYWSLVDALVQMQPYADANVVYVTHYYYPYPFTHQGATWMGDGYPLLHDVPYPAFLPELDGLIAQQAGATARSLLVQYQQEDWDADHIEWDMQLAASWARLHGVRVVVNEFGAYKPYTPVDSRARWLRDMRVAMERQGFGWAMWDYHAGFDLIVESGGVRSIDSNLAPALGLEPWTAPEPVRTKPARAFAGYRTAQIGASLSEGSSEALAVADIDGDGRPDLMHARVNWPQVPPYPVEVFLNLGGGVMRAAPDVFDGAPPQVNFASLIVAGRFDASGRPGFFFPDQGPAAGTQSRLVLPAPNGRLRDATANLPAQQTRAAGAAAADIDGDGVDDLVALYQYTPQRTPTQLLRNNGAGVFTLDQAALPASVTDTGRTDNVFACAAFVPRAGAAVPDLLLFGAPGSASRVLRNDGTGRFSDGAALPAPPQGYGGPITGNCAAVGDLSGDGLADVIVGFQHPAGNTPDYVQILIHRGDGTFADETAARIAQPAPSTNGLRQLYLLPANNGSRRALLMVRVGQAPLLKIDRGDGVFLDVPGWAPADYPWSVTGADFNGDGWLDIVSGPDGVNPVRLAFGRSAIVPDCAHAAGVGALPACAAVSLLDVIHSGVTGAPNAPPRGIRGH
jgi:endoglucanase